MAHLRVHVVGKIERRRVGWQLDDVTLGTDGVHAIFEEVVANLVKQVLRLIHNHDFNLESEAPIEHF